MIDELISGVVGSMLAGWLSKRFPPRLKTEFAHMDIKELRRRNGLLLVAMYGIAISTAGVALWAVSTEYFGESLWQIGLLVGLPATLGYGFVLLIRLVNGRRRARELTRYFEIHGRVDIRVVRVMLTPLVLLGLVSAVALAL